MTGGSIVRCAVAPEGLCTATTTIKAFLERLSRLYEQQRTGQDDALGAYVRRWITWLVGGLGINEKPRTEAGLCVGMMIRSALELLAAQPAKQSECRAE